MLTLGLGDLDIEFSVKTVHRYRSFNVVFDLKQQQEDVAQQLDRSLPAMDRQLIEEASCLCCYGLQMFALTERLDKVLRQFQKSRKQQAVEV
jgi:hypothetical protein